MSDLQTNANVLLVPMSVQAMMVGKSPTPTVFANIPDDYTRIMLNPLGDLVPSGLMGEKLQERSGVHLHWVLPVGLRQGVQKTQDSEPEYPKVPTRWVVSRLWSEVNRPDALMCKHWVVESDALELKCSPEKFNDRSLTYPDFNDIKKPYRMLGRSYDMDQKVENPSGRLQPFTAIGPGNPAYSAMYSYCVNVFGFYDDLLGADGSRLKNINLSYVIRGVYSDDYALVESHDACQDIFGWQPPEQLSYPATAALHGVVTDMQWQDDATDYNGPVIRNLAMPKLAVGNTSVEALSALYHGRKKNNESLLRYLLYDQSHKLLKLNGFYKSDYTIHELRFQNIVEKNLYQLQNQMTSKTYEEIPEISEIDQILFRNLQAKKQEKYTIDFDINSKRSEIYDLWCKYMLKALVTDPYQKEAAKKWMTVYEQKITEAIQQLKKTEQDRLNLETELIHLEGQLKNALKDQYDVHLNADSRYYAPNSPVLLLSGAQRGTVLSQSNESGEPVLLKCRVPMNVVKTLSVKFELRGVKYETAVNASDLLTPEKIKGILPEIFLEGTLLSLSSSRKIAEIIGESLRLLPFTPQELEIVNQAVQAAQKKPFEQRNEGASEGIFERTPQRRSESTTEDTTEVFPDPIAMNDWKPPWNPIMLCWRGLYYPDLNLVSDRPTLEKWKFNGMDYVYNGPMMDTQKPVTIEGRILLTPHVSDQLKAMVKKHFGGEIPEELEGLSQLDCLSQVLDGFNNRFLMDQLSLRFPIVVFEKGSAALANQVQEVLSGFDYEQPIFNSFYSPLRGGFFKFDQLRLIDTFSQFQNVDCRQYAIAEDLRPTSEVLGQYIMLPPRFIQATQLDFQWINARNQTVCDFNLPDSPICGWMIPNRTDQSLLIYDERGNMLGSLIVTGFKGDSVQWRCAPGVLPTPSGSVAARLSDPLPERMNPEMKAFLSEMLRRSQVLKEDVLTPFLKLTDSALWDIQNFESAGEGGLSLFAGKPLVLVKANMKLKQMGPPEKFKLLESNTKVPVPIPDTSIKNFKMPLWIGETQHTEDGVVGFFLKDGLSEYNQFNSAFVAEDSTTNYMKKNNQIEIAADDQSMGTQVALVMDPMASIHLISGFLPVSEKRIPKDRIEFAMNNLYLTFYTGPMLLGEGTSVMPLTNIPNREWAFIYPSGDGGWYETKNLQPANGNAFLSKEPIRAVEGWLKLKEEASSGS